MRRNRGPSPKWKRNYGERSIRFYEAANRVEVIPTQRALDFVLKHHLYIGALLNRGVRIKDIWLAAQATKGFTVGYSTFYNVCRRFADFLGVPKRQNRKRLRDEQLQELARVWLSQHSKGPESSAVTVEIEPRTVIPAGSAPAASVPEDVAARRRMLKAGVRPEAGRSAQIAQALRDKI
jgi:hypothetical protein